ncbi:MAG: MASE1 domain-containing protein [Paraburkholderia sp.]|jgi:CBS domain-containing protein|nr:MASE1 domain-containing protein [Paraburkholderia sp.]
MATIPGDSWFSRFLYTGIVALANYAGAKMGLAYAVVGGAISLVWPSSGIALVAVLALGNEVAPGIAIGFFLANVSGGVPLPVAAVIGTGSMIAPLSAAIVLTRATRFQITLDRVNDVLAFIGFAALMSTAVSALVKHVPVLKDGRLVGIVSGSNLIRALANAMPAADPASHDDASLRDAIVLEMHGKCWGVSKRGVLVKDGVAHLWGVVEFEEKRRAIRIAAEGVPGVKRVEYHLESPNVIPAL